MVKPFIASTDKAFLRAGRSMVIVLFGTEDSVYVRIVRLVLEAKNIGYEFVIADVFDEKSLPAA
ncbi:MAG: glutathione S-transferase N-terminal domain-containing protein, partial [Bradyrhizobium sp.]